MNEIVRIEGLTKRYGEEIAVNEINMTIRQGDIYGFVGQNGAGKSTTIRMITGLGKPESGQMLLFGKDSKTNLENAQKRMGALIEGPCFYENMTASENMETQRKLLGVPGKNRSKEILQLVGLDYTGRKKAENFSLGMKQRLGIALALLNEPELLILDEPTNGLDPVGIVELRQLLRRLNEERGMTLLVSSHILSELEQIATKFGFIHRGRMLQEISAADLKAACRHYIEIVADDPDKAAYILVNQLHAQDFEVLQDGTIKLYEFLEDKRLVSKTLTDNNLIIEKFVQTTGTLEQYFTKLIGGGVHG